MTEAFMRQLLRYALALGALGLGMIGCNQSRSPDTPEPSGEAGDVPHQVVFRVPGMS
jgi:hypothetical protein